MSKDPSLRKRLIVIDIMIPTTVLFAMLGNWPFTIFVSVVLGVAAWEFWSHLPSWWIFTFITHPDRFHFSRGTHAHNLALRFF